MAEIVPTLSRVLEDFKRHREGDEAFGDYCERRGSAHVQALV
jgi:sulfite reductase beta subunit-like hemoprotein